MTIRRITIALAMTALAGCGPYGFSPGGKGAFKTVAIPLFENQTSEYGIRELLTEGVINRFIQDGGMSVVNERSADAVLRGVVVEYKREPFTYDASERVKEYRVTITIQARLEDPTKRNVVWEEKALSQWGVFQADTESDDDGKRRAIEKLAEDILNRTVKGW
jgi:outer membrane lipopolysaccharide assembly protein LptE/RlpB